MVGMSRPNVPVVERQVDADTAGDGEQVDDGVGRAADGAIDADGILEGGASGSSTSQILVDHGDDARRPVIPRQHGRGGRRRPG
jgi:hypothetical protein